MKQALVSALLLMLFACPAIAQDQTDNANDTEAFPIGHGHDRRTSMSR